MQMMPITSSQPERRKQHLRVDAETMKLLQRLLNLRNGRHMLTVTKTETMIDLTELFLGDVERLK